MSYAIMRIAKHKTSASIAAADRHAQQRDRLKHRAHPERTRENMLYKKHKDLTLLQSFKSETEGMKIRKNGVLLYEIVLAFSPEKAEEIESRKTEWVNANMKWCADNFGGKENILFSHVDLDETTLHCHIFILPRYENRLNASHYTGSKYKLSALQTSYAEEMECFGLERGKCYVGADCDNKNKPRHITLKEYYRKIEKERSEKSLNIRLTDKNQSER